MSVTAPYFSVIVPTYNRARQCAAAVASVLAQTDVDFECYIVDDGSTDDTKQVLERFKDPRLKLIFNEKNRGQHACRNQAIRLSRGKWITFLDSDDVYLPERLAAVKLAINHNPQAGFIFTNAYLHRYGRIIGYLFDPSRVVPSGRVPGYYAVGDGYLPYVTTMVALRADAFGRFGYFREDLRILEDTELYARMFEGGLEVASLRQALAVRFIHEGQITRDHLKDFEEAMIALNSSGAPPDERARVKLKVAREVADYLWRSGRPVEARALWQREVGALSPGFLLKTALPSPLIGLARAARKLYLEARYHPAMAPADFRAVTRTIEPFFHS